MVNINLGNQYMNNQYARQLNSPSYENGQQKQRSSQQKSDSTSFGGALTEKETQALTDCYVNTPSQSVLGAAGGGALFGIINNPRLIVHPWNSIKATSATEKMFKAVTEKGSALNQLWTNPETNDLMREAYFRMHKIEARNMSKLSAIRRRLKSEDYQNLKKIMEDALATGNKEEIAEATAKLQQAYINDGWISKPIGKLVDKFKKWRGRPTKPRTVAEALADTETIAATKNSLLSTGKDVTIKDFMKKHASMKGVIGFALFDFAFGIGNIKRAFAKDRENRENGIYTNYGLKQLGQTTVKGLGSGIGWGVGEALANFSFSKWGTKIGSKARPWIGAGLGGVVGVVGGSVGLMILGRITKALVGNDIGEKIAAEDMAKTPEGQIKLLQGVYEKAKKGEASPEAQAALQKAVLELHG